MSEPTYTAPDYPDVAALRPFELAFPGPLRDALVAAVLSGAKTTTTGLLADYEHAGDPLPQPGGRSAVIDSAGRAVAVIETTDVRVVPLADVDLQHAIDEGEGYATVAHWRSTHERFWRSPEMLAALGDPGFTVDDRTPVVLERFRMLTAFR
ncbi:ASCH domain-containing protein [Kitasatospora sp. NPDC093558]|uniref:ASCH domain-containing protein n=1 Tax=Kitasatospora sp. NPDC093558 TaxID=3155201 RepID=UPI00343F1423